MAHLSPYSMFASWVMTPSERDQGTMLTTLQKQCIQNQVCQLAQERNQLKYDPSNPMVFMQRDAELQGQILALQFLITSSEEVESRLNPGTQLTIDSSGE